MSDTITIDTIAPAANPCAICGEPTTDGPECDECFYGMRLDRKNWLAKMKAKGIEIERGIGCMPIPGGFVCGNPYKRKAATGGEGKPANGH